MSDYLDRIISKIKDMSDEQIEEMLIEAGIKEVKFPETFNISVDDLKCKLSYTLVNNNDFDKYFYYDNEYIKGVA